MSENDINFCYISIDIFGNTIKSMGKHQGLSFEESQKYVEQNCLE